jgi:hypothetical protein
MDTERKGGKPAASEERQASADKVQAAAIEAGKLRREPRTRPPEQAHKKK